MCTSGTALIGRKTIHTVVQNAQKNYDGASDFDSVRAHITYALKKEFCTALKVDEQELKNCDYSDIDIIIAGFDEVDVSKPRIEKYTIFSGVRREGGVRDDSGIYKGFTNVAEDGEYAFTACCIGETSYTDHLLTHDQEKIPGLTDNLILWSLSDAKDFCEFLVNFTCDYQRFSAMVPTCGRPIISAVLTPLSYKEFGESMEG